MNAVLVDSNVLLDIANLDNQWFAWSDNALQTAAENARLVINAIIYGEVSVRFSQIEELDAVLPDDVFHREAIPFKAGFLAGKAHMAYRRLGGTKRSPLPDFIIGAHAMIAGYSLLTRDAARYRGYFPKLHLISP